MPETVFKFLSVVFMVAFSATVNAQSTYAGSVDAGSIDTWLDKMSKASTQQNFKGTLIIRQNNMLQAIKVKQGITQVGSWQTLESLTGEDQTIIRQDNKVTTIFPNKKLITIAGNDSGSVNKGPLHPTLPENRHIIKQFYTLKLSGQDRVANKMTQILKMIPRDKHRYGYTFWLDKQSGMLLKCDLMDEKGRVLEQLMYSNVELLSEAPVNNIDTEKLTLYRKINLSDKSDVSSKSWQAMQLPDGFTLTRSVRSRSDNAESGASYHMVFSDGMASVSVFIEQGKNQEEPVIGQSSMGPVNAYSSFVNDAYVTAIGEVPAATVRMIATSIQPVK